MRALILAIILAAVGRCAAGDYPSPNRLFALRIDAKGARLILLSTGNVLCTVVPQEDMEDDGGWVPGEVRWDYQGLCIIIQGREGNHRRYSTLSVWRFSESSAKASVEEVDLLTPFYNVLLRDKDRDTQIHGFGVAEVNFGYDDRSLTVNYQARGTGSGQWSNEPDNDYYICNFTYEDAKPLKLTKLRRVRTTLIDLEK